MSQEICPKCKIPWPNFCPEDGTRIHGPWTCPNASRHLAEVAAGAAGAPPTADAEPPDAAAPDQAAARSEEVVAPVVEPAESTAAEAAGYERVRTEDLEKTGPMPAIGAAGPKAKSAPAKAEEAPAPAKPAPAKAKKAEAAKAKKASAAAPAKERPAAPPEKKGAGKPASRKELEKRPGTSASRAALLAAEVRSTASEPEDDHDKPTVLSMDAVELPGEGKEPAAKREAPKPKRKIRRKVKAPKSAAAAKQAEKSEPRPAAKPSEAASAPVKPGRAAAKKAAPKGKPAAREAAAAADDSKGGGSGKSRPASSKARSREEAKKAFSETQWFMQGEEVDADLLEARAEVEDYSHDESIPTEKRKRFTLRSDED